MGEYRNHECCEPKDCCQPQNCCTSQNCCHDNCGSCSSENNIWMIILVILVLCLLCGGDNKGGLFGGLF